MPARYPPPYAAREYRHPGDRQGRVSPGEPRRRASRPVLRVLPRVRAAGGSQLGHAAEDARKEPAPALNSGPEQTLCPAGAAGLRVGKGRRCCHSRRPRRILLVLMGWEDEKGELILESEVFARKGTSKGVLEEKNLEVGCVGVCLSLPRRDANKRVSPRQLEKVFAWFI